MRLKEYLLPWLPQKDLIRELYRVGVESLWITMFVSFVLTAALIYQTEVSLNLTKYGLVHMLGAFNIAIGRELIPLIVGLVVAARVGAAFAAEIAHMRVSEQIDALRSLGVDPEEYLVTPRLLSCAVMIIPLTVFAVLASFASGVLAAQLINVDLFAFMTSARIFFQYNFLVGVLMKAITFGVLISLIACWSGFAVKEKEGTLGIGGVTTRAVVFSFLAVFLANFVFALILRY